jgi:hypothetical protein
VSIISLTGRDAEEISMSGIIMPEMDLSVRNTL